MNRKILYLIFMACASSMTALAQTDRQISLETSAGYHHFPGFLFSLDQSVTKHPDSLAGLNRGYNLVYALNKQWFLGLSYLDFSVAGDGEWARSSTAEELRQGEVDGIITGHTQLNNRGLTFHVRKSFLASQKTQPYFQVGGGIGWLKVRFNGKFIGYETTSGLNFPVEEDASDSIRRKVPLINLEAGIRRNLSNHLYFLVAPYWNTGWGAKLGLGVTF